MPPVGVLIKPASGKCNMKCGYCFYNSISENRTTKDFGFMTDTTIELIVRKVLQFAAGTATFSFQGGEPTLRGMDFFKNVLELQKKYNVNAVTVHNCIQTNGMLINEIWAGFLSENNFLVGLSLDGPTDINDANRVDSSGKGTFKKIMHTVDLFNKYVVDYNILHVVTDASARSAESLYNFYRKQNFNYLQFIPCIDPAGFDRGSHSFSLHPQRYGDFLKRFFQCWYKDFLSGREISIRYFDNLVRIMMGTQPETCSMLGQCRCQFVFEADGSVYPCDFYVVDEWKLGNIYDGELLDLYNSDRCAEFLKGSLKTAPDCDECQWKVLCRGGCRRDRENLITKESELNYYCEAYQDFFRSCYPMLKELALHIKSKNAAAHQLKNK